MAVITRPVDSPGILQRERPLRPDLFLLVPLLILMGLGIIMVYTASRARLEAVGEDPTSLVRRHVVFVVVGLIAFLVTSLVSPRTLKTLTPFVYGLSLASLVLALFVSTVENTNRWIRIGDFQVQPSEFAKVAVILALAAMLAQARDGVVRWYHLVRAVVLVGIPAFLIFKQPDLGTMLVLAFLVLAAIFAGGASWRQLAFLGVTAVIFTVVVFQADVLEDYQLERLSALLDQSGDLRTTAGYNQAQSEIAIGSGGFFGKGLFGGTQTNLSFVPVQSTDFIFTAVAEQLGFVGGSIVIGLYAVILWRVLAAAFVGRDRFAQLVAVGVAALLMFHIFVNIGMTMGLMPVTGLPLPFLSAGGSAIVAMSVALGMTHSIWMRRSTMPGERAGAVTRR